MAVTEDVQLADDAPPKSNKKLLLLALAGVIALLVLGAGTAAAMYFLLAPSEEPTADGTAMSEPEQARERYQKALYLPLDPPFTVNFQKPSRARFLQLRLQAMTRHPEMGEELQKHMPVIRNRLVLLFSSQSAEELGTREGKEKLQAQTLEEIQQVLRQATGEDGIEAVYFTSFVMQ
jgi:flagellar FliL protein